MVALVADARTWVLLYPSKGVLNFPLLRLRIMQTVSAATGLYPPWSISDPRYSDPPIYNRVVEYSFLFAPPEGFAAINSINLDVSVLLTVWVVVLAITFGLISLFGLRRSP